MFLPNSRYVNVATVEIAAASGERVTVLKPRRLTVVAGDPHTVEAGDRLDLYARRIIGDATQYWRVADANTALDATTLTDTPGATLLLPKG